MNNILTFCQEAIEACSDVVAGNIKDGHFQVFSIDDATNQWTVSIESADIDEKCPGAKPMKSYDAPLDCVDHFDVLSICLAALYRNPIGKDISDLSTDGDGNGCEAIFQYKKEYLALKVRS